MNFGRFSRANWMSCCEAGKTVSEMTDEKATSRSDGPGVSGVGPQLRVAYPGPGAQAHHEIREALERIDDGHSVSVSIARRRDR
jgi:hypothetical protein